LLDSVLPSSLVQQLQQHLGRILKIDRFAAGHQHSWLLLTQSESWVLRLNQQQPCYGLDYQRESAVLQQLKGQPWIIEQHPLSLAGDFLLYRYQAGQVLSDLSQFSPQLWQQLLQVLGSLPSLGKGLPEFDMRHYLQRYLLDITHPAAQHFKQQALRWFAAQSWPSGRAFNHHDLHLDNMLLGPQQQLLLLDWEYAATSMPGWDAASVAQRCPVNAQQRADLIALSGFSEKCFSQLEAAVELLDLAWYWQYQPSYSALAERSEGWLAKLSASGVS